MNATMGRPTTKGTPSHGDSTCDVDNLNSLLKGELSAVETYDQALAKFAGQPVETELRRLRNDHREAVSYIEQRVRHFGGTPATGSGAWGAFAQAVTGTAKVIGPATTLSALKQGEEHGLKEYEEALNNEKMSAACRESFRTKMIPQGRQHLAELDRLMQHVDGK